MRINKYLQYGVVTGLFLTLLVPFVVSSDLFFPFITGKNFFFRILTETVFVLWAILALRDATFRPRFSWLLVSATVFIAVIGIADFFSPNVLKSFWSNYERMEGYVTLLHLFGYFIAAASVLNSEKRWAWFFQTSVGVSVIMGFYGILQLAGKITINQGGVRLDGTLGNATYLAAFMLMNFFLALFLLMRSRKVVFWRWIYGAAMVLQIFILYHTATRGAAVGLAAGTLVLLLFVFLFSHHKTHRSVSAGLLAGIIFLIIVGFSLKNSDFVKSQPSLSRLTSISTSEAGPRFMVWNMAWQGFKERPVLGWGQESFNYVFNKYYDPKMYSQEQWFDRTHNVLFDWLIAGGSLGLLAYLSLFALALYYIWKQGDLAFSLGSFIKRLFKFWRGQEIPYFLEKVVLTGLLVAYFVQNLFVFDNVTSYILFFGVLAYVHSISGWPLKRIHEREIDAGLVNRVIVPLAVVALGFVIYSVNIVPMRASASLIKGLSPQTEGPSKNLEFLKKAIAFDTFGNSEIREQLAQAAIQVIYSQSTALDLKQEYFDFTRKELNLQIEKTPNDARYHLFLGSFLNRVRSYDEALVALKRAQELSPRKQTIMFELASVYINKGDMTQALAVMKEAYELEEDFKEARIIYAVAAIYAKDFKLASELTAPLADTPHESDDRLVQAYAGAGKYDTVISLLQKRVVRDPLDSGVRFSLAGAYISNGQRAKAIEVLREVANEFPNQAEQADYYIREIQAGRNP